MNRIIITTLFLVLTQHFAYAQGIIDSVFKINAVEVKAEKLFKKEEAGMKETHVDTMILQKKINVSLSELLSENTPVYIKSHGRGAYATASFRGTAASHTQVNWNGININSPMAGMVDFSLIPVYIIDDMNLKHGTASIADQSGGLGGSINIGNRVKWDNKLNFKYLQGIGSYSTYDEFLQLGGGNEKVQLKTRLYHNSSKNDYTFINRGIPEIDPTTGELTNPLDTNDQAAFTKYGLLQEIYYRPERNNIFSVKYWGQAAERTIPRATTYEGPDNSNLNKQADTDHKIVADWKHLSDHSALTLRNGFSYKNVHYIVQNLVSGNKLETAVYSQSTQKSSFNSLAYSYCHSNSLSFESKIDYNHHGVISEDTVLNTGGYNTQRNEVSAFFALRKSFAERLNMNLMLRQELVNSTFAPLVPFIGFDYKLSKKKDWLLKGNVARNYHQPSLNDLYWQPGGNPNLLPEQGISSELGTEYQTILKKHIVKTELTAYRSDMKNWILWVPSFKGYWEPRNINKVISQGFELNASLNGTLSKLTYRINGNYTYTSSKNYGDTAVWGNKSYGKQLVHIPLHSGNVLFNISYKGYYFTYQHNSYSERHTTSSNDITRRDWLYPYFMNDIILGKTFQLKKVNLTLEFKTYNLFNETYHSILYRPMPGRNYMFLMIVDL